MSSKSTFSNSTSRSYAVALYELGKENSELDKIEVAVTGIKNLFKESKDFKEIVLSPAVNKEEKKNAILAIAEQNNFTSTLKKFLGFLATKNRLFYLNQIIDSFLNFLSNKKGELKAKLLSSKKLTNSELEKIKNELSKDFKSNIKIDYQYNPDLIAGLIIQVGSVMVDSSIKSKLKQLEKSMIES